MKIAVCGKGGCGKSTVTSLLAKALARRGKEILVIDSDESNYGLHRQLGMKLPRDFTDYFGGKQNVLNDMMLSKFTHQFFEETWTIDDIPEDYYSLKDGVKLMTSGKIHQANEGCSCAMGTVMTQFIQNLRLKEDQFALMDMEAGIEHFGRGIDNGVDLILIIIDPSYESLQLSKKIGELSESIRKPFYYVLNKVTTNYNRRNKDVRLYELGNIYLPKSLPVTELPDERTMFTLGMYGNGDFFDMKGVVEEFFDKVGMDKKVHYDPKGDHPYLHPGRKADIVYEGRTVGFLGEIHPEVAENYKIGDRAYVAVIDMPAMTEFTTFDRKYTGIAKFPAVTRDISMVVPKAVLVGQIEDVISQRGGKILESCKLFDIYEGAQVLEGHKSVAYSITFRAKDHTLEEKEVTAVMNKILNGLKDLGIELRA